MTVQDTEIISAVRLGLADRIGQDRFDLWFGSETHLSLKSDEILVGCADQFSVDWIRNHFRTEIEAVVAEVLGRVPLVRFQVDPVLKRARCGGDNFRPEQQDRSPPDAADHGPPPGRRSQRKFARLDRFVTSPGNRVAYTSSQMVISQLGAVSPLYLFGPHGVGKTHLLEGMWSAVRSRPRSMRPVYLSAEQFTSLFLEALHGRGLPSFRRKYRDADLLLIDDVQFFLGKRATITELLHTTDALLRQGRQLIFAADRSPAELASLGPELTGRMSGGLVCRMELPDRSARFQIARQMARDATVDLPDSVLNYIAVQFRGDSRVIRGAINRLKVTSEAIGQPITLGLAEQCIGEMILERNHLVGLVDIERAVCDVLGLEPKTLRSDGRSRSTSHPRMLAMWLARKYTRAALTEIGHYFGRRSHTTVISAQKTVQCWITGNRPVALADRTWPVEEAIEQIETRLRTG